MTNLRLRSRVNFPATVRGIGGIGVAKSSGEWIVQPQFSDLPLLAPAQLVDPATKQIWVYDAALKTYAVLSLLGLSQALTTLTSTTSTLIATGPATFTVQANKDVVPGQFVTIASNANPANSMAGIVTAYLGTSMTVNVLTTSGAGTFADWTIKASGVQGPQGIQGLPGTNGIDAGFKYSFNSATAGDPGVGKLLFNNAAFMSATQFNISETDGDGNGLAAMLATLDDSTTLTSKCLVVIARMGAPGFLIGYITGAITDAGAYDTYPFSPVLVSGTVFGNNDVCRATFYRVGDKGIDGTGTGDFSTNTAVAVDGEVMLFNGTTGKSGRRATGSGITKITAGVQSVATAGTDYVAPNVATLFTRQQSFPLGTLIDGATINWDVSIAQKAKVTLGAAGRTMAAVTNPVEGTTYSLWVIQDATGNRTITTWTGGAGGFDFGVAGAPLLSTAANRADLLTFEALTFGGNTRLRYSGIMRGFA